MTEDFSDYSPADDRPHGPIRDAQYDYWERMVDSDAKASGVHGAMAMSIGTAVVAAAVVIMGYGWRRFARSTKHIIPSAADIPVRMPPPR